MSTADVVMVFVAGAGLMIDLIGLIIVIIKAIKDKK